jgi:hypothetical protein
MSKLGIFREFWEFVTTEKTWWLFPLIILLLLLGFVIVFLETSAFAPFIYPFF